MKIGKILAGILVVVCLVLIFTFTLKNLLKGLDEQEGNGVSSDAAAKTVAAEITPVPTQAPVKEVPKESEKKEEPTEEATEEPTEEAPPEETGPRGVSVNGFRPEDKYTDTMGEDQVPEVEEDYVVETIKDVKEFWDNGKENRLAFKNFIIIKNYKNEKDLMCDYFVDIMFKDGSSLEGLRCNDVSVLTEKAKFRYGYVIDDSSQENGQNVMYLHLVQE